ncbi:hypothetical protein NDU88_007074 [Pleurodeles waltl]|uniref:Uncharacterized protein n=1 Tax=Pleurodeles waltl TaxID=8319 RepID=A0AAV7WGL9_PLEWA|nr:hypothetical protein NDU88_007074 [Pleurodeles waltl]
MCSLSSRGNAVLTLVPGGSRRSAARRGAEYRRCRRHRHRYCCIWGGSRARGGNFAKENLGWLVARGAGLGAGLSGSSDKVLNPEVKTLNCPATERTSPHRTVARGAVTTNEDQKHPGDPDEETQPPPRSRPPWQRRSSTSRVPKLRHSSPSRSRPPPGPRERLSAAHPRPEHGSRDIRAGVGDTVARQRERAGKRRAEEPEEPPEVPVAGDRELSPQNPWRQPQAFPPPCPWQNAPPPCRLSPQRALGATA